MKATAIDDVMVSLVAAFTAALSYPVFDGPPTTRPVRSVDRWLVVGAEDIDQQLNPTITATMQAQIIGLGGQAREEELSIECIAVGKEKTIAGARAFAAAVVEDASQSLPHFPSANSYAPQVSAVTGVHSHNVTGGAIVQIHFTISARARLT